MQIFSNTITKCRWLFVTMYLLIAINVQSQTNVTKVEYFFDTDPGFGLANNISITAATDISDQLYNVDISNISNGFHNFYIRSKDENGVWSITNITSVFRRSNGFTSNPKLIKAEYYFDSDPGFGNGTTIPLTASNNISDVILNIDLSNLSTGFHSFYIRTQDENGSWSITNNQAIFKTGSAVSNPNIVAAEYFFDTDPGFGNGSLISFAPSSNISNQILNIDISAINIGFHSFFIRTKDANGGWSLTNTQSIFKTGSNNSAPNLVKAEYFFDSDPGFGNAFAIDFADTTHLTDEVYIVDLSTVSNGFHSFNFRTQDGNGAWSLTNRQTFFKFGQSLNLNIVKAEYFIDSDPGFGNAIELPINPALNITDQIHSLTKPATLTEGTHTFFVRTQDANGIWGLTNAISFDHVVPKSGSGYCLQFTGTGKKIVATQQTAIKNNFTMEVWVNATATTPIQTQANNGVSGTSGNDKYVVMPAQGTLNFGINTAGVGFAVGTNGVCVFEHDASYLPSLLSWNGTLNGWNHIVIVYTNKQPSLYINGKLVATGLTSTKTDVYATNSEIGGGAYGNFSGSIDEFRIWDVPLSQTQIRERMCRKITENDPLYSNLYINYNFDEISGNTVFNKFSINNNATLLNAPSRILSGAAIGDTSIYSYVTSGLPSALISSNFQDSLSVVINSGTYTSEAGLQLYLINTKPNSQVGLGGIATNNDRYFGVFACNVLNSNHTAFYKYSYNPFISGINESELGLFKRADNATSTWTNSDASLNSINKTLQVTGQNTEYILSNCASLVTPTITVNRNLANVCNALNASYAAIITNGGSSPMYQWKLNGNDVGFNLNNYVNNSLNPNDTVYCVLTTNASCYTIPNAASNKIVTTVINPIVENVNVFGCFNATYNSTTYTASTNFIDTLRTFQSCDSIYRNVTITVYTNAITYDTVIVEGCNSLVYNGITYTNSTSFTDTIKTSLGCDNIYRFIDIVVHPLTPITIYETLFGCGSYTFNNINYVNNTTVRDTVKSIHNCDSIYNIHNIIVTNPTTQYEERLGCGYVDYNSVRYAISTVVNDTLYSHFGCDSIYKVVNIVVLNSTTQNINLFGCNSILYKGIIYSNSTIVKDTIKNILGCDSIYINAILTINHIIPLSQTVNYAGCNSVVYDGVTYMNSTVLNQILSSYQGCDSVYKTVNINVYHLTPTTNTAYIRGCNSIVYNSNTYTSSIILRDTIRSIVSGCDSIYNIVNIDVTNVSAVSQVINLYGCDSVIFNGTKYTLSTTINDTLISYQGCDSVYKTTNINIILLPIIDVSASVNPVCSTSPTILTATGGSNYTWSPSTSLSSSTGASVIASPFSTTTYTVTSTNVCVVSKQITVNVNALPNVDAGANQSILLGSSTILTATGALHYNWNTGNVADTTASINVSPIVNTNYIVTGTNDNGCIAQDLVTVSVNFSSINISPNNYNFGNVVTSTISNYNITITNNGTLPITLNNISVAAPYSGIIGSQTINAGNSVSIPISFAPTANLFYTKILTISTSIGDFTATLQGRGVSAAPAWVVSPSIRNFGNVQIGDSAIQTFTITNTGNVPISTSSITSNSSLFSANISNAMIAVGGNAILTVKYKPSTISSSNAIITINSATSGLTALTVNVNGAGYVNNTPPILFFTNTFPYNGLAGVNPSVGQAGYYTYRVVYKSSTNTPPQLGYPQIGIDKNGDGDYIDNDEGLFSMNKVNNTENWVSGEEYTYSTSLSVGNNFGYRFFANDSLGNPATLSNTGYYHGPTVTDQTLDLSIYANDITFSVAHPNVGQTFTVSATVHNNTPYSANNVNIRFYTDSVYYNQTTLPFIGANSTAVVSMNFVYNTEGFYPIKVWIDSSNNLGEANALNNYAIRPIIVGAFSVPGTILITSNAYPQTCPTGVVFSGNARYSGLNLQGNPPVLGATVTVKINGIDVGSTYTVTDGNWSVYVPYNCGTNNYLVEVTDFTLTGITSVQYFSIPCGVSCGSYGNGNYNYQPNYYTSSSTPCCLINNQSFNYALTITNNGTASSYKDTIKVFVDGNLSYTHILDSLQISQIVNYNDAFVLSVGNHTLSYKHSYYNSAGIRSEVNGSNTVYIEQNLPDLYLANFSQNGNTSFSVRNYNSTCTVASSSKLFIYETNSSYGSPVLIDSVVSISVSGGKCSNTSVLLNYNRPIWTPGYHYLTLVTDGSNVVDELNENNNSVNVIIYVPQPDLFVTNIDVSNNDVHAGDVVNFMASIKNNGAASSAFKVQFKVNNVAVGSKINIASLGAGSITTISSDAYIIPSGNCPLSITVIADVDDEITELVETNNSDSIAFASDLRSGYNCNNLGSSCNPYTVYIGKNLDMQSIITNVGLRDVDTTHIQFKIGSTIIGSDNVYHLANNSSLPTYISHTFNSVGTHVITIEADYDNQYCESNEVNNVGYIYVNAVNALPDLRILSQHISPSNLNPAPGQSINVVSTVQNIGNLASTPAMVRFWVDDIQLGVDVAINSIKPGRDTTVAATINYSNLIVGPKILKVKADINQEVTESDTTNNTATRAIIVGGAPDFARSINEGITFNRQLFRLGKRITISNYIRNYGGDSGRAVVKFFYSTPSSKVLIDSVPFRLNDHDSIKISTNWIVAVDSGRIISEIVGANPQEFNVLNNVDSVDFITDKRIPNIIITPNYQSVCEGVSITFSASAQNVIMPVYRWKINGIYTGDTTSSISKIFINGDIVSCDLFDEEMYLLTSSNNTPIIRSKSYSNTVINKCVNQLPFIWNGNSYNVSGIYSKTFMNTQGCDSIATLQFSVLQATSSTTIDSIYAGNSYLFNGNSYTVSGTYTVHFANANGCDSSAILILTVKPIINGAAITGNLKSCEIGSSNRLYCSVPNGIWKSSDTTIAKISQSGIVTSISNGSVSITYTYKIGNVIYMSNALYNVSAVDVPQAISGTNSICVGSSILLTNATLGGYWTCLNNRASIDANTGLLTGLNGGYAAIVRYTVYNSIGCSAYVTKNIMVNSIPAIPSISYAPGTTINPQSGAPAGAYCVGKTFGVVGFPSTPGFGTWSSTGVASITNTGIVTINSSGNGSIQYTYTNANGCSNSRILQGNGLVCASKNVLFSEASLNNDDSFEMYPNPAKMLCKINVHQLTGSGKIIVTDLYGKTVKTQILSIGINTIDISHFSKGLYLASIITNENKMTQKLVVE